MPVEPRRCPRCRVCLDHRESPYCTVCTEMNGRAQHAIKPPPSVVAVKPLMRVAPMVRQNTGPTYTAPTGPVSDSQRHTLFGDV